MAPSKVNSSWEDDDSDSSTPPSSPPLIARRSKFEDEEDDSDVLESWDAAEDSEVEREKVKKAAEAKAKAEAEAKANHKSKSQRIEEKREARRLERQAAGLDDSDEEEEDEATRRARLRATEKEADLRNAEDLFAGVGGVPESRTHAVKPVTVQAGDSPEDAIDLTKLKIFQPTNVQSFVKLRETLVPLLLNNSKKPQFESFVKELTKQLAAGLNSEQIKKVSSGLTALSNEKMREEKAAEKGGKKTKAAKTKITLTASRDVASRADTTFYDDGLEDDDFM